MDVCGDDPLAGRFRTLQKEPWSALEAVRQLPDATPGKWWVPIPGTHDRPMLLAPIVAMRKSRLTAEKAGARPGRAPVTTVARSLTRPWRQRIMC
jgi:hypothetical protein